MTRRVQSSIEHKHPIWSAYGKHFNLRLAGSMGPKTTSNSQYSPGRNVGQAEGRVPKLALKLLYFQSLSSEEWRKGEIRTPDTVARMPDFECGAFNHSATSPGREGLGARWLRQADSEVTVSNPPERGMGAN